MLSADFGCLLNWFSYACSTFLWKSLIYFHAFLSTKSKKKIIIEEFENLDLTSFVKTWAMNTEKACKRIPSKKAKHIHKSLFFKGISAKNNKEKCHTTLIFLMQKFFLLAWKKSNISDKYPEL